MQDTEPTLNLPSTTTKSSSPKHTLPASVNMSPYTKYGSPPPCSRTPSPCLHSEHRNNRHQESSKVDGKYISDDEISVGCPSPRYEERYYNNSGNAAARGSSDCRCQSGGEDSDAEEYFKPLKKLKMVSETPPERRMSSPTVNQESNPDSDNAQGSGPGVKSFSIIDILSHRPAKPQKIVRPWDIEPELTEQEKAQVAHQQNLERFHRQLKAQQQHQLALLRSDLMHATSCYTSETGSDRSSSVTSDCCSPDHLNSSAAVAVAAAAAAAAAQRLSLAGVVSGGGAGGAGGSGSSSAGQRTKTGPSGTPLDALFQMTSKTFDQNASEANPGEDDEDANFYGANHLNLFNNRQQPKKKRKSRTAFTNHQIFELEKRFLYQKYLSPADRDEIASSLGLSNAQVITWFQNRRAKLKRDMEELKKDVENTKILNAHKSFLENVQDLGLLKKKAMMERDERESACGAKNLVISEK